MDIQFLNTHQSLEYLQSFPSGLSAKEVANRLKTYGLNIIEHTYAQSTLIAFFKQFFHFFAIVLWFAAGLAFIADYQSTGQGMNTLGFAIVLVILVNGLFSYWQEYRAKQAIASLQRLLPIKVKTLRDGVLTEIIVDFIVPGDVIILQDGDNVPADCRVLEANALRVNYATITGESLPRVCDSSTSTSSDILNCNNILLAGTLVVAGEAKALVFATGMNTEFGKIAHLSQSAKDQLSPLQEEIIVLSRVICLLAVFFGIAFFLIAKTFGMQFWPSLIFGIGIIVALVPEGLLPTVTLSLAMATQRIAKRNALIRNLSAVEALGSATVICTDKTGTLTKNSMQAELIWLGGNLLNINEISKVKNDFITLFEVAGFCHNLKLMNGKWQGDPVDLALFNLSNSYREHFPSYIKIGEIPFDSERKRLSTFHQYDKKRVLFCKGAPETVIPRCKYLITNLGRIEFDNLWQLKISEAIQCMADKGLRVLAIASRNLAGDENEEAEQEMVLSGLVGLADPIRPEAPDAIRKCHEAGIKVIMITGDHPNTALAIARQVGLASNLDAKVITGSQLKKMDFFQIQQILEAREILFARVGADQKMQIVQALKRMKHIVAVTGDGVNDTPALRAADIGISMGLSGTDAAKSVADMILLDDNFSSIVAAIEEGRAVFGNIRKFLTYILTSNIPELVPFLGFALFKIPLALTISQILLIDLGTDIVPALGLGAEKPDQMIMKRPPRLVNDRLIDVGLICRAFFFLGLLESIIAMLAFFYVLDKGGWHYNQELSTDSLLYFEATTATLSAIIVAQIANVLLCRSETDSLLKSSGPPNRLILYGISLELAFMLITNYSTYSNHLFSTAALDFDVWVLILLLTICMILLEELRKYVIRQNVYPS